MVVFAAVVAVDAAAVVILTAAVVAEVTTSKTASEKKIFVRMVDNLFRVLATLSKTHRDEFVVF